MKQNWKYKCIKDICKKGSSNIVINKIKDNEGEFSLFGASGLVKKIDFFQSGSPYIGIVKDGSGVGKVNSYPAKSSLVGTMQYIFPNEGTDLSFLKYALQGLNLSSFASGAAIPHIYFKDYGKCKIPVPEIEEQRLIAEELDLIQSIIDKQKHQLLELDNLQQSIFHNMFGDLLDNKKSNKTLKEVAEYFIGLTYKPSDVSNSGTIVLRSSNIQGNQLDFKDIVRVSINVSEKKKVKEGDILMCARNGSAKLVGKVARIKKMSEEMSFGAFMTIIRSRYNDFLFHFFKSAFFRSQLNSSKTATINQITSKMLDKIQVPIPPLALQKEFAEKIEAIECQKELIKKSIADSEQLFNYTMDKYFG